MELRKIQVIVILLCSLVLTFGACKDTIIEKNDEHDGPENETAKIGFEFEYTIVSFTKSENKKASYFKKAEKLFESPLGFEIQTDYLPNNKLEYSDLEMVTKPFMFNLLGLERLYEATEEIESIFLKIQTALNEKSSDLYKSAYQDYVSAIESNVTIGKNVLEFLNHDYRNSLEEFTIPFDQNFYQNGKCLKSNVFLLKTDQEFPTCTPQVTLPLNFSALVSLYETLSDKEHALNKLLSTGNSIFSFDHSKSLLEMRNKYESDIFKNFLIENGLNPEDKNLRGFIYLVYTYVHKFHFSTLSSSVKNGLPFINARNDFATIFQLLPDRIKEVFIEKNSEQFIVKLFGKLLFEKLEEAAQLSAMKKPLFNKQIYNDQPNKSTYFLKHLNKAEWLENIVLGEDLLELKTHLKHYPNISEREKIEFRAFSAFGKHLELLKNKPSGIFEIRKAASLKIKKGTLKKYVEEYTRILLSIVEFS